MYELKNALAKRSLEIFTQIMTIPRGSGNVKAIADYLENFASEHNIYAVRDISDNIYMRREEKSEKSEKSEKAILLQAHTDMVCEKNKNTVHDFLHDPIKQIYDSEWLHADGTTLGADDGIGMAIALAALTSPDITIPIEALFTSDEEIGLIGASNFDYTQISAKRLINLDSETDGEAVISCAGGVRDTFELGYDTVNAVNTPIKITVGGLAGGHSGTDIHLGRGNANRIMGRVLCTLYDRMPFNLISISGGMKSNAIPRECEAVIAVFDKNDSLDTAAKLEKIIKNELRAITDDKKLFIKAEKIKASQCSEITEIVTLHDTGRLISLLTLAPEGVVKIQDDFVITSTNIGVIEQDRNAKTIRVLMESRSSCESELDALVMRLNRLAHVLNMDISHSARYPGWALERETPLQKAYITSCAKVYPADFTPKITAIHAGLECGLIKNSLPDMDIISIGATVLGAHTPEERLYLPSLDTTAAVLTSMLE